MFHSARHVTCRRVGQYFCLLTIFAVCLNISQYRSGPGQAAWLGWVCSVWPGAARARGSVNFANMAWPHHRVGGTNFGIKATTNTSNKLSPPASVGNLLWMSRHTSQRAKIVHKCAKRTVHSSNLSTLF